MIWEGLYASCICSIENDMIFIGRGIGEVTFLPDRGALMEYSPELRKRSKRHSFCINETCIKVAGCLCEGVVNVTCIRNNINIVCCLSVSYFPSK